MWRLSGIDIGDTSFIDVFGSTSPDEMPTHFFMCGTYVSLNYGNVRRANVDRQTYSVMPRVWYVDTTIVCKTCGAEFLFSIDEQETWYEEYLFYVDSFPNRCKSCRADRRHIARLRHEYDAMISEVTRSSCIDIELKRKIVGVIDKFSEAANNVPAKMLERRRILLAQIRRLESVQEAGQ